MSSVIAPKYGMVMVLTGVLYRFFVIITAFLSCVKCCYYLCTLWDDCDYPCCLLQGNFFLSVIVISRDNKKSRLKWLGPVHKTFKFNYLRSFLQFILNHLRVSFTTYPARYHRNSKPKRGATISAKRPQIKKTSKWNGFLSDSQYWHSLFEQWANRQSWTDYDNDMTTARRRYILKLLPSIMAVSLYFTCHWIKLTRNLNIVWQR